MPTVSGISIIMKGVSDYFDSLLFPCSNGAASCLKDTRDFLKILGFIVKLPATTILAIMDLSSVHTSIPHEDRLQNIKNIMFNEDTASVSIKLSHFFLTYNYFRFWDSLYIQMNGTCMASLKANIFTTDLEACFLCSCLLIPLIYLRYINDMFIMCTHGKESLVKFHWDFNTLHISIKLALKYSTQQI